LGNQPSDSSIAPEQNEIKNIQQLLEKSASALNVFIFSES